EMRHFLPSDLNPDDYWPWQGEVDSEGYGVYTCTYPGGSQRFHANRSALIVFGGKPVYNHEDVVNTCGNKLCCNPRHLQKIERAKCLI
ncbi:hypothetical protein KA005_21155, partial [bacterium]|nr:hypothetical protein [bacterium]